MKIIKLSAMSACNSISGIRLDVMLSKLFQSYSRSYLKKIILMNRVFVNDHMINKPDKKILPGKKITIYTALKKKFFDSPENIFLNIIYEDQHILIINKPSGLVVHPGAGQINGTLLNALLYYYKDSKTLPRAGIVHRLDKYTSGLIVVAKTMHSYNYLLNIFKKRKIIKEYQAIVIGNMISGGTINAPIMRHNIKKKRMMIHDLGKESITHYKIIKHFDNHTHIKVRIETGRTHQIRVHMMHVGYPIFGDRIYNRFQCQKKFFDDTCNASNYFFRQALHSSFIKFYHPVTKNLMSWSIPLPKDMKSLLSKLV